jgi:hypothetical protein
MCNCYHISTRGRIDYDHHEWQPRDNAILRKHAEAWKHAPTAADQKKLFEQHGIRWSELWRLPYWNPACQLVVDAMHCILEGLTQYHSREVLGLTTASALSTPKLVPAFEYGFKAADHTTMPEKEVKQVAEIHLLLAAPIEGGDNEDVAMDALKTKLQWKNLATLQFVGISLGCGFRPDPTKPKKTRMSKSNWAEELVRWVSTILLSYFSHPTGD